MKFKYVRINTQFFMNKFQGFLGPPYIEALVWTSSFFIKMNLGWQLVRI